MEANRPPVPEYESDGEQLVAAIHTRRRIKCIAEGAHPTEGECQRCGL